MPGVCSIRQSHEVDRDAFDLPGWLALSVALVCLVFAFGQSLMVGNMLTTSLGFLPAAAKADGNAVINTPQQLSGAIGTAVATAAPTPTGEAHHDPEAGAKGLFAKRKVTSTAGICGGACQVR